MRCYIRQTVLHRLITEVAAVATYTDLNNNTFDVRETIEINEEERKKIEEEIVEELYRIFTQNSK